MTVDQLLKKLNDLSQSGYGDMLIFLGEKYPLLESAITILPRENELQIRNTYYDNRMAETMTKTINELENIRKTYISECILAGMGWDNEPT
nr:MAG TPA: hypothetical protein [Bacteriophage sp.]